MMTPATFKMILGLLQIGASVIGPFAAGMPFNSTTIFMGLLGLFTGGHAITSAVTHK